ncbi:hypothetical protein BBF96_04440 [Anoxybacter fermentans]|uniref:ABC transporter n=1 Tax=Anoxybacter fermentans TaxID=1323375 RepID=A0A3S9SWP4_9FIRM|nr:ABC transporter ATP-binding protein [Anoxybacter fermentans]AZR72705.1 hypothetical protein BBF96_04440 [Anoxybacter fermentans]
MSRVKALYKLLEHYRKEQIIICILIVIDILLTSSVPFLIKDLVNYITSGDNWTSILKLGLLILFITICNAIIQIIKNYRWHLLRFRSINYLRLKMFYHALRKPMSFFDNNNVGGIMAKVLDDVVIVAQHAAIGLPMLFANLFQLIIVISFLFILELKLAVIIFITMPIYYIIFHYLNSRIRETSKLERVNFAKVMKDVQEKLLGVRTIKIFKKEKYMVDKFSKVLDNYLQYVRKTVFLNSCGSGLTIVIMLTLPVIILIYGGFLVYKKEISLGTLIAFYTYLSFLYEPIRNLSDYNLGLQTTLGMCERVLNFLQDDKIEKEGKVKLKEFNSLEFKNVSFQYENGKSVLSNLNFRIDKGDRLAIVGPSGSGKSTILNLIMKLYSPDKGKILVNGIDIREISSDSLYALITLLEQNHFLFEGTIKENITFGEEVDFQRIRKAAMLSKILPLIQSYENGFDHLISDSNLSGGEKQRLCLARSLLKDAQLVLLDEATSSVDPAIEKEIVDNLDKNLEGKTLVAVSHRPQILSICNKVIHLSNGQIIGCYTLKNEKDYEKVYGIVSRTLDQ